MLVTGVSVRDIISSRGTNHLGVKWDSRGSTANVRTVAAVAGMTTFTRVHEDDCSSKLVSHDNLGDLKVAVDDKSFVVNVPGLK